MTRRLRIAGTAFGAMLVPACAGFQPNPPTIKPVSPPIPTAAGQRPAPVPIASQTARPRTKDTFADGRSDPMPTVPHVPTPWEGFHPDSPMRTELAPVEHQTADVVAAPPVEPSRLSRAIATNAGSPPPPEPVPDGEGVIRSDWPVIKGFNSIPESLTPPVTEPRIFMPVVDPTPPLIGSVGLPADRSPMKADSIPAGLAPPPVIPPAAPANLPPGVIGTSVHQSNASPVSATSVETPLPGELTPEMSQAPGDSPLIRAVRAFQQNKPEEAVEHLKAYDAATQQLLLSLLPAMVRIGDGRLQQMKPEEADALLHQFTQVPVMLRSRASLQANNVRLCREVHNFAHVEPFPDRHTFRPGDIVYLYMELANFTPMPAPKGGYLVTLVSSLELRDSTGGLMWRADPKEVPDLVSTPPQDYYRNFRLCVPTVPPGVYMLTVKTTDRPTGREARKTIEMRIGAR
jgi:hypothetical protein